MAIAKQLPLFPAPPSREGTRPLMLRDLPAADHPLARLQRLGPGALSTAELLTVILSAPEAGLCFQVLAKFDLAELTRASLADLAKIPGIGPARAAHIQTAFELGRRALNGWAAERPMIRSPQDAANLLMPEMGMLEQEQMRVLLLDTRRRIIGVSTVYQGNVNATIVRMAELFRDAVKGNCPAVILVHNHPSGEASPSPEDVKVTEHIVQAGKMLDIEVIDHLILGRSHWVSLKERGLGVRRRPGNGFIRLYLNLTDIQRHTNHSDMTGGTNYAERHARPAHRRRPTRPDRRQVYRPALAFTARPLRPLGRRLRAARRLDADRASRRSPAL